MFDTSMGIFHLELKLESPLFLGFTVAHSNSCVPSCRPFVVITFQQVLLDVKTSSVARPGFLIVEVQIIDITTQCRDLSPRGMLF